MDSSEWTELAKITARLDELRKLLDAAEEANRIAAFHALDSAITELETTRDRLLRGLIERVVHHAAA
jgi:transcription elongation GreA/GreB family factor